MPVVLPNVACIRLLLDNLVEYRGSLGLGSPTNQRPTGDAVEFLAFPKSNPSLVPSACFVCFRAT
jgi:hypothetical protein